METDVLIIGGGPAGLHAAGVSASYGLDVTLVEQSFSLGGQLRQQTQQLRNPHQKFSYQTGTGLADQLIEKLHRLDVITLLNHTVIGTYNDGRIGVANEKTTIPITSKKIIVTTGAAEEAFAFPGWTLPGVMTIGAAQILLNRERVLPGKNALVVGINNFTLEVVKQLQESGVQIKGIIEEESLLLANDPATLKLLKDINTPIFVNGFIERAFGSGEVEKVMVRHENQMKELSVDLVCIGKGLSPIIEPFEILDCDFTYESRLGGWLPKYTLSMETSCPSIYVAGNAAGTTDIGSILLTAEIAGLSVAASLNKLDEKEVDQQRRALWKAIRTIEKPEVFQARAQMIKMFQGETLTQLL